MLEQIVTNIIEITLALSAVILLMLLVSKSIIKLYPAKLRYWIWLAIAVRLIIPLNISLAATPVIVATPTQEFQISRNVHTTTLPVNLHQDLLEQEAPLTAPAVPTITLMEVVSRVWLCGAILFCLVHFISYFLFLRKTKRWRVPVISAEIQEIYKTVCAEMKITRNIPLCKCSEIISPMMVGLIYPLILLPSQDFTKGQLRMVLQHE